MTDATVRQAVPGKPPPLAALLAAALAVFLIDLRLDAQAVAKAPAADASEVKTGDPLPRPSVTDRRCKDRRAGATRWLDSNPHVPFFVSGREHIESAAPACCATWAVKGSRWRTIGPYGEVVGTAEVTGGEGYDVTQCYELQLQVKKGEPGVGIFASQAGDWRPPARSARWEPREDERAALVRMVAGITSQLDQPAWRDPNEPWPKRWDDRILTFEIRPDPDRGQRGGHFAAVGGRALIIARLDGAAWKLAYLDTSTAMAGGDGDRPLAAFDIDGDGIPELIYHWDAGDSWADVVLRLEYRGWVEAAESIGGSTA